MPAGGRPTVRSRRLGAALRKHRQAAGMDQAAAAEKLMGSVAKVSRMETGKVTSRPIEVRLLLDLYEVSDPEERERLESLAREGNRRGWWLDHGGSVSANYASYIELESDATHIVAWQLALIPGLLQTPAFAMAVLDANPAVVPAENRDEFIKVRAARQRRIEDGEVRLTAIVWEPAVTAPMSSPDVHREQLDHLLKASKLPNVTIQILPLSAGNVARVVGPFTGMSFGQHSTLEAVSFEGYTNLVVVEAAEELGWYVHALENLRSAAWTPEQTSAFLRKTLRELSQDHGKEESS
ncbi:helix-turn-helix transcriptional regulator [Kitasatospora kazusensis]|uniref:Helix-turn-helix transcriptional regulator n=1 Tax=Kitasatospora kazusensis TaxID=407974 RepID=A0ABP5KE27_9ACTN